MSPGLSPLDEQSREIRLCLGLWDCDFRHWPGQFIMKVAQIDHVKASAEVHYNLCSVALSKRVRDPHAGKKYDLPVVPLL